MDITQFCAENEASEIYGNGVTWARRPDVEFRDSIPPAALQQIANSGDGRRLPYAFASLTMGVGTGIHRTTYAMTNRLKSTNAPYKMVNTSELRTNSEPVDARIAGRAHYQAGISCLNREILHVIFVEEISDKERDLPGPSLPKAQAGIDHAVAINHRESRVGRLPKHSSTDLQFALQIGLSRNAGDAHNMRVFTPPAIPPNGEGLIAPYRSDRIPSSCC
jgi:hypothetical protein